VTVLEIIQKSTEYLSRKGVESPRLQSESILAHVLALPRMQLYLNFERKLSDDQVATCRELVQRRGSREPLQHLVGTVSFCGLEIRVGRQALIPRPETEQLAEHAESLLPSGGTSNPTLLDFGTGSGCIAIALATRCPHARVSALDVSTEALTLARTNAELHKVLNRIDFLEGNGFSALPPDAHFDLIVSNPPYIPSAEIDTLEMEVKDFDPRLALDGGIDGLDFYRMLATEAAGHLNPRGAMVLEFGDGQARLIADLLRRQNWIVDPPRSDYSGRDRFLIARVSSDLGARSP
jgi:release factor glutamine methyltransferase